MDTKEKNLWTTDYRRLVALATSHLLILYTRNFIMIFLSSINRFCDRLISVLGFDWFHLFLSPKVHDATVSHALRAFCLALLTFTEGEQKASSDSISTEFPGVAAFRKDLFTGGWTRASAKRGHMGGTAHGALPFGRSQVTCCESPITVYLS